MQAFKLGIDKVKALNDNVFVSFKDVESKKDFNTADLGSKKMSSAFSSMI
jgi:hypothetical protein